MKDLLLHIETLYGLKNLKDPQKVEKGILSENHIISDGTTKYFLKKYRFTDGDKIKEIHDAKNFFAVDGIPVILPILTKDNQSFFSYEGGFYTLFPFVEGRQPERGKISDRAVVSIAKMLAKIHLIGRKSTIQTEDLIQTRTPEDFIKIYNEIQEVLAKIVLPTEYDVLAKKSLELKKKLVLSNESKYGDINLPNDHLIHGDYVDYNIFFDDNDEVSHVFDFEKTRYAPRVFELFRSMMLCGVDQKLYIEAYNEVYPISKEELQKGFTNYFVKQSRSLWLESEHYLKNNSRPDQFLPEEYERLLKLEKNNNFLNL